MKKLLITMLMLLCLTALFAADFPTFNGKVLITSAGQSQDGSSVVALLKRNKYTNYQYGTAIFDNEVDWASIKTLIVVIGGSGKGLGSAGLDVPQEQARVKNVIAAAKKNNIPILGMHIGGEDRRKSNSEPFLGYANDCDALIIMNDGNKDGYFTKIANEKGLPILYFNSAAKELSAMLKTYLK